MGAKLTYQPDSSASNSKISLVTSKSISNRLSVMQALSRDPLKIEGWSEAEDSRLMRGLIGSGEEIINAGMAGTVFRFLTAFYALKVGSDHILTGSKRMLKRPVGPLVKQLRLMGAQIDHLDRDGYPPIRIKGQELRTKALKIDASQSSQFVTALLLIAPYIRGGLEMEMVEPTSKPYVDMTISLMKSFSIELHKRQNKIVVEEGNYQRKLPFQNEADWSAAAFFYEAFVLSDLKELFLEGLKKESIQGDKACYQYFETLGVQSNFERNGVHLTKTPFEKQAIQFEMSDYPDLALPFAVAAAHLMPSVSISGLHTLRIKESDRLAALKAELEKITDAKIRITKDELFIEDLRLKPNLQFRINSHNDHRLAMCLAPIVLLDKDLILDDPAVVEKSFPAFWVEMSKIGVKCLK